MPGVIVIHENRGLNRHIQDVARRVALGGYFAVAPDFLSEMGGTPADEDKAREMSGRLELQGSVADAVEIGRAHVWTPFTNAHLVCRLLLEKKNYHNSTTKHKHIKII